MQRFKEALQRVGIYRERELTPFEKARKVMEAGGGRELILRIAKELRESGDESAIVEEKKQEKNSSTNKLTLRWDLRKRTELGSTSWVSKEVSILAVHTGNRFVEVSFFSGEKPVPLSMTADMVNTLSRLVSKRYTPPINLRKMSFEDQLRLAMKVAKPIQDFRYGEGEKSLAEKPVKNKYSKNIF